MWRWRSAAPGDPATAGAPNATAGELLSTARAHLAARRWDDARRTAELVLQSAPENSAALVVAGEACTRLERFLEALKYYRRVSASHPEQYLLATRTAAEIHRVHGSLDEAEADYRTILQLTPDDPQALTHLATLLMLTARPASARPVLLRLVAIGGAGPQQLQWLADPERPAKAPGYLERSLEFTPSQVFPRLGLANLQRLRGETASAEKTLAKLRRRLPQQPEIEAVYARCLLEQERLSDLAAWWSGLSNAARNATDNWYFAGVLCESRQQPREACRCYLECLQRNPDHREASHRAGRILLSLGLADQANHLLQCAESLAEIARLAGTIEPGAPQPELCQSLSALLEQLGRNWEGLAWADLAARGGGDPEWIRSAGQRLSQKVQQDAGDLRDALPGLVPFKLGFPMPEFPSTEPADAPVAGVSTPKLSFIDDAAAVGIDFTYFEDPDPSTEGRRMREFTGGGVAVLDFDVDGWPDLYFTQGAELSPGRPEGWAGWVEWDVRVPGFECPSDVQTPVAIRTNDYLFCIGDSANNTISATTVRGTFGYRTCVNMRDVTDGTSNTIAMSEGARGLATGNPLITTSGGDYRANNSITINQDPVNAAGACRSLATGGFVNAGLQIKSWRGRHVWDGQPERVEFTTILPPNSVSCAASNNANADSSSVIIPPHKPAHRRRDRPDGGWGREVHQR